MTNTMEHAPDDVRRLIVCGASALKDSTVLEILEALDHPSGIISNSMRPGVLGSVGRLISVRSHRMTTVFYPGRWNCMMPMLPLMQEGS